MKEARLEQALAEINAALEKLLEQRELASLLEQSEKFSGLLRGYLAQLNARQLQLTIFDGAVERPFGLTEEER